MSLSITGSTNVRFALEDLSKAIENEMHYLVHAFHTGKTCIFPITAEEVYNGLLAWMDVSDIENVETISLCNDEGDFIVITTYKSLSALEADVDSDAFKNIHATGAVKVCRKTNRVGITMRAAYARAFKNAYRAKFMEALRAS